MPARTKIPREALQKEAKEIGSRIEKELRAAGRSGEEARAAATLISMAYRAVGTSLGEEGRAILERFGLVNVRGPEAAQATEGTTLEQAFELPSIDIEDDYFLRPKGKGERNLPDLPVFLERLLQAPTRFVRIPESVAQKNWRNHKELRKPGVNQKVLQRALYSREPTHVFQTDPVNKPNYWAIARKDVDGNFYTVLEVSVDKDANAPVSWFRVRDRALKGRIEKARREGGQFLISDGVASEVAVGRLSASPPGESSLTQGDEGDQGGTGGTFFQTNLPAVPDLSPLGFYSQLQREVQKMDFKAMPAKDLIGRIKNLPGIKAEELEYSGLLDWLNEIAESSENPWQVVKTYADGNTVIEHYATAEEAKASLSKDTEPGTIEPAKTDVVPAPMAGKATKEQVQAFLKDRGIQWNQTLLASDFERKREKDDEPSAVAAADLEWDEGEVQEPDSNYLSDSAWDRLKEELRVGLSPSTPWSESKWVYEYEGEHYDKAVARLDDWGYAQNVREKDEELRKELAPEFTDEKGVLDVDGLREEVRRQVFRPRVGG